jgi:formylglycine-generating enzyme required for sulfatase activity
MTRTIEGLAKRRCATVGAMAVVMLLGVACTPSATVTAPSSPPARSQAEIEPAAVQLRPEEPALSAAGAALVEAVDRMPAIESELASVQEALASSFASPEVRVELEREAGRLQREIQVNRQRIEETAASELRAGEAALAARDFRTARRVASVLERVAVAYPAARPFIDRVPKALPAPAGCVVVTREPDPAVVTDAAALERMNATGLPWKIRHEKTGIVMLLCPSGDFVMGSPKGESGRGVNEAQQRVEITAVFYISETEVTQEEWQRTMGANPSKFKGASKPVDTVTWNACQEFCQRTGLRLPSESEWEYACRAGTTGAYAGDIYAMGWYSDNSAGSMHPVRQKRANPWGLHDMHGNVWEWCADVYADRAAGTQAAGSAQEQPRVLRGGSWYFDASFARSSGRYGAGAPGFTRYDFGFRVARDAL